jgi:hypothetical protein
MRMANGAKPSFCSATEPKSGDLAKEAEARQRIGLPSRLIDRGMLRRHYGIDRRLAIPSRACGEIDPVHLAASLIGRALRRGARLFATVEITSVPMSPRGVLARTKTGLGIAASSLIYAAGYEVARRVRAVVTASSRPGRSRRSANRIDFGRRGASYGKPDGPPLHPHNAGWPRHRRRRGRHQRRAETRRPDRDEDGRSQRLRSIEG